jgi:hypothetical protein
MFMMNGHEIGHIFFPAIIERISNNSCLIDGPLEFKINKVLADFGAEYTNYTKVLSLERKNPNSRIDDEGIRLTFWGYDASSAKFFGRSYFFLSTNQITLDTPFERGVTNFGSTVTLQGEIYFLSGLIYTKDAPLTEFRTAEFKARTEDVLAEHALPEKQLVAYMLGLFELHKQYAAKFGSDKGLISPPYTIYKITKEHIARVH